MATVDESLEPGSAHVARVPLDAIRIGRGRVREEEGVLLELSAVRLVERRVEIQTIVEDTRACEDRRLRRFIERVRHAESRLNRTEKQVSIRAIREVATRIDVDEQLAAIGRDGVTNRLRRHVVAIVHASFDIPSNANIERQARGRAPVILRIGTELRVVLRGCSIADPEVGLHRVRVAVAVVEDEQRIAVQILIEVVLIEVAVRRRTSTRGCRPSSSR